MEVLLPRFLDEALEMAVAHPEADLLAGGTDLMVEINFGRKRPATVIVVQRLPELAGVASNGHVRAGAGVTYTELLSETADGLRAMREMARTVGSPQIRNAGTLGGNLGTCSPAGDSLPVLAAYDARVLLRSREGERSLPFTDFMSGPKRNARRPGEVIVGAEWADPGPAQIFMKVGTRNAMVIAVASLCLVVDRARTSIRVALGSCGPTILRAAEAESFARGLFDESGWERPASPSDAALARFGALVASAARPIDDVRGTAAYRRHVLGVIAERALRRVAAIS